MEISFWVSMIVIAIISYLFAGLNGAIIASKLFHHEDIRTKGSGNPGFTNYKRVYGNGIVSWSVLLFDVGKTAFCVWLAALYMKDSFDLWHFGAAFSGLMCMLGHCFPVWYGLKGGKAFMAGFATTWFVDWRMALIAMAVFFMVLYLFRYMSVASCTASLTCPIALYILGPESFSVWILCLLSALLVIVRHKSNFIKLINHEESTFSIKKS